MKQLIIMIVLVIPVASIAAKIGDYSQMTGVEIETNRQVRLERTLIDLKLNKGLIREVGTDLETGEVEVKEVWETRARLLGKNTVRFILMSCSLIGGSKETVETTIGKFKTCKLNVDDGTSTIWVGKVPFGIVQVDTLFDFGRVQGQITDFQFAQ